MTDQYVQLAPDSSGKKIDTSELTVNSQTVERQRMVIGDPVSPTGFAEVTPAGELQIQGEPHTLLVEPFASLDTTNTWQTPLNGGGGVLAAVASGVLTVGTSTTANAWSYILTQASWRAVAGGFIRLGTIMALENPITSNAYRFWGAANPQATPTAASPIVNGVGFELTTAGVMACVIYSAGTRIAVGTTSVVTDTSYHDYLVYVSSHLTYWVIDNVIVAQTPYSQSGSIQSASAPFCFLAVAGTSGPSSSGVITSNGVTVSDTAANHSMLADATYPWRQAAVSAKGVQGSYALQVHKLTDTGRSQITAFVDDATGVTTEALVSTSYIRAGSAGSATTFTVASGKTFRITAFTISVRNTSTVSSSVRVRIRSQFSSSATTATSPVVAALQAAAPSAVAQATGTATMSFAEGVELQGGTTWGITWVAAATTCGVTICVTGFEY